MAQTFRGIRTPDLADPALFTSQLSAMAENVDDAIGEELDTVRMKRSRWQWSTPLTGSWSSDGGYSIRVPSTWSTYRVSVSGVASVRDVNRLDGIQTRIKKTTSSGQTTYGPATQDNAGADRVVAATAVWEGLSGPQTWALQVRRPSGSGGSVASSWLYFVATKQT